MQGLVFPRMVPAALPHLASAACEALTPHRVSGTILLMYSLILSDSVWIVALMLSSLLKVLVCLQDQCGSVSPGHVCIVLCYCVFPVLFLYFGHW